MFRVKSNPPFGRNEQIILMNHYSAKVEEYDYQSISSNSPAATDNIPSDTRREHNLSISKPNDSKVDIMTKGKSARKLESAEKLSARRKDAEARRLLFQKSDTAIFV